LWIHQDARIYAGNLNAGTELTHNIKGKAYVLISEGEMQVNGIECKRGDGFAISDETSVSLSAKTDCEVLVIEVPGLSEAR
jgi:redox-sensitive bicupin YhaK (pirin superfamily)